MTSVGVMRANRSIISAPSYPPPMTGRAIAYDEFRRLDRSAKRGAERPYLNDLAALRGEKVSPLGPAALGRDDGAAICDSPAMTREEHEGAPHLESGEPLNATCRRAATRVTYPGRQK